MTSASHRQPDFNRLLKAIRRNGLPDRVPFIELFADTEVVAAALNEKPIYAVSSADFVARKASLRQRISFCQKMGYDYVWAYANVPFIQARLSSVDTAPLARPHREWVNESAGMIATMADYEAYPWPTPQMVDYHDLEFISEHLPDGMQIIATTTGILEGVMWLMGYAPFALALYDQPDLVEAMFRRIGDLFATVYETVCDMPNVGALFIGDDMGHRSGTMIHPDHLRRYVFPRQKRLVEITHAHGLPFLMHACGNLHSVMDDLIDTVGIDGKHSFEDTYLPVAEAKRLYGDRISILGGVDVDFLVRHDEEEVRAYTRRVLESCMPNGGYALGTGNSVANYIPIRNYLAMLDEGMKAGIYS